MNIPAGPNMHCNNCGNTESFVLLAELTTLVRAGPTLARPSFADPDWSLGLECHACASTDVEGDPATLLAERV